MAKVEYAIEALEIAQEENEDDEMERARESCERTAFHQHRRMVVRFDNSEINWNVTLAHFDEFFFNLLFYGYLTEQQMIEMVNDIVGKVEE